MNLICRSSVPLLVILVPLLLPSAAAAQAAITGVVRDTSGAVLPGVTVETSSPALIERVRSVVTDTTGQYRVVDLRPGTYLVTVSLPGFATVKREGIELSGNFVATVNAELRVGALEETHGRKIDTFEFGDIARCQLIERHDSRYASSSSGDVLSARLRLFRAEGFISLLPSSWSPCSTSSR